MKQVLPENDRGSLGGVLSYKYKCIYLVNFIMQENAPIVQDAKTSMQVELRWHQRFKSHL